jgi:tRNA(Ile)-lysidine synthase
MESFNNRVVEALSRTATQMREDGAVLSNDSGALLQQASIAADGSETKVPALDVKVLANAPPALRRRALRLWLSNARGSTRRLEMVHLSSVENLLKDNAGGKIVELPAGGRVVRRRNRLEFESEND